MKKWIPWIAVLVMAGWVISTLSPGHQSAYRIREFGKLPVLLNGRVQPFDSMARNALLQIRGRQTVPATNGTLSATEWLLEAMTKAEEADGRKVFRVDNGELLALLKLPENQKYYAFNDLTNGLAELDREGKRIGEIEQANRTVFEKQLMMLFNKLALYHRLKNVLQYEGAQSFGQELEDYVKVIPAGVQAEKARSENKPYDKAAFDKLISYLSHYDFMNRLSYAMILPPSEPGQGRDKWSGAGQHLMDVVHGGELHPVMRYYANIATSFERNDPAEFAKSVVEYRVWMEQRGLMAELAKGSREFRYNDLQAFYKALVIYVLALVLACLSWINGAETLRRSSYYLIVLALILHTVGIIFRMVLEGRPPVTNLYSSAVFIGWGAAVLGLILERMFKDGIGCVAASAIGFTTLIIAHHLSLGGDTMEMLRAVLDTNFWLATHVVTVTLGYSATFMAGFLAILYIIRGVLTRTLTTETAQALTRMVYGILCFALLFSFVGTVLGGIWADQSWGRFWGWDPKENGALIIVLWNAAILHARWSGVVRERGLMNMAIFGNIVTSFSWFGVNMLGIGLHSYGFMDAAFFWLMAFIASQLALIGLGCLPLSRWMSFRDAPRPTP